MAARTRDEVGATNPAPPPRPGGQVCAVVVTYHPPVAVVANIEAIRRQVDRLWVIDNSASPAARAVLAPLGGLPGVALVFNAENRGIAAALNQGVELGLTAGFDWIATFDQDSAVPRDFIRGLLDGLAAFPARARVALVAPLYRDRSLGFVYSASGPVEENSAASKPVSVAAASGNLVSAAVLRALGGFREDFFVDCVDFEFCLRCRRAGWLVLEVRAVTLDHAQGHWQQRRWLWKNPRFNDYDAVRRYYQARNRLVMYARFAGVDPRWLLRDAWGYACDGAKLLLFCEDRWLKVQAMATGGWHALTGRRGRWQPAARFVRASAATAAP